MVALAHRSRTFPDLFYLAMLAALLYRFLHFAEALDDPHAFRQCETAWMAYDFYQRGVNLLAPSVCWLGPHRTLVLEFPIYEAIVALGYRIFGPYHAFARLLSLLCFAASIYFLHSIVRRLHGLRLARLTAFLYAVTPLSLFYSRAVHIDACVMALALAMTDAWMRAIDNGKQRIAWLAAGTLAGIGAFLIKAPYAFYLYAPLAFYALARRRERAMFCALPICALPVAAFILWRIHAESVNASAPDWGFIPGYHKFINMGPWDYGSLAERFSGQPWAVIAERLWRECCVVVGLPFLAIGLCSRPTEGGRPIFLYCWLAGLIVYLLIFFKLNMHHNYYQIPFLPVTAFFIAAGVERAARLVAPAERSRRWLVVGIAALIAANAVWTSERRYYWLDSGVIAAGETLQRETPPDALLIAAKPDSYFDDPQLLYRARRLGWPLRLDDLSADLVARLRDEGAGYLAAVSNREGETERLAALRLPPPRTIPLTPDGWTLHLYRLGMREENPTLPTSAQSPPTVYSRSSK